MSQRNTGESPLVLLLGCARAAPLLAEAGVETMSFGSPSELLDRAKDLQAYLCMIDAPELSDDRRGDVVLALRRELPFTDVLVWHPGAPATAVREALLAGASDVALSPDPRAATNRALKLIDEKKVQPYARGVDKSSRDSWRFEGLISRSQKMWDLFETCVRTAATDATVLVLGETGTGKELIARAIHRRSGRKGRFVALNCGAVPESLIDSELFGHEEGAFTGATGMKEGLFRHADQGTLFLDEIGAVPLSAQFRLLRALQEDSVRPVGGSEEVSVNVRVIAATSAPLDEAVGSGTFREDLLYRLDVIRIVVPPLRERFEDVVLLFEYFSDKLSRNYNIQRPEVSESFLDALQSYDWPGNVRQLENYAERLLLTVRPKRLTAKHFQRLLRPFTRRETEAPDADGEARADSPDGAPSLDRPLPEAVEQAIERVERTYLETALRASHGRISEAAERAGISRRTLLRKLQHYDIDKRNFRTGPGSSSSVTAASGSAAPASSAGQGEEDEEG